MTEEEKDVEARRIIRSHMPEDGSKPSWGQIVSSLEDLITSDIVAGEDKMSLDEVREISRAYPAPDDGEGG